MPSLHDLQHDFAAGLLDPSRDAPEDVMSTTVRHPRRRFDVYRNNVMASLVDVLEAYFPVVTRLVGREYFRAMARDFVTQHPPRSPILSRFGEDLAAFIAGFEPVADVPYLADVARLEWLQQRAYHAADRPPLSAMDLAQVSPERVGDLILELHPSTGLLSSPYPVFTIWRTNTHDDEVRPIDLGQGGEDVLVVRAGLDVLLIELPAGACALLAGLRQGRTLAEASRSAHAAAANFDLRLALATLIEAGAFASIRLVDLDVHSQRSHSP